KVGSNMDSRQDLGFFITIQDLVLILSRRLGRLVYYNIFIFHIRSYLDYMFLDRSLMSIEPGFLLPGFIRLIYNMP
ncbi:hypothetical protein ACJX0J_035738, partial [Zea mays]